MREMEFWHGGFFTNFPAETSGVKIIENTLD